MKKISVIRFAIVICCFFTSLAVWGRQNQTEEVESLQDVIIYEVNLRAFSENADLQGVIDRMDDIEQLGVNVIWLMPIHPIGEINRVPPLGSPYSIKDYRAVSDEHGVVEDLHQLILEAHQRDISVIMDFVANHTAWDHPWITSNPDWYTQDANGDIIHPPGTNWLDVADLNYSNSEMRNAMIAEMKFWIAEVGIDGFRMDAADFVPFDFWQVAIAELRNFSTKPLLLLAEGARSDHYVAGFDLTFGWQFYGSLKNVFGKNHSATAFWFAHQSEFSTVPLGKEVLRFTTNHDESAFDAVPPTLFGSLEASQSAFAIANFYGGTPLVYGSQEIGWPFNIPFFDQVPIDWSSGTETELWYKNVLGIRKRQRAVRNGNLSDFSNENVVMALRTSESQSLIAIVNTRGFGASILIPEELQHDWYDLEDESIVAIGSSIPVAPYEVRLFGTHLSDIGDVNRDGSVNLLDVGPFVDLMSSGLFLPEADINGDASVNLLDVAPFIELLSGG